MHKKSITFFLPPSLFLSLTFSLSLSLFLSLSMYIGLLQSCGIPTQEANVIKIFGPLFSGAKK